MQETVAIFCDMHLLADTRSMQYEYLLRAVDQMRRDGVTRVLTLGDLTAYGDPRAWDLYLDAVRDFSHFEIIGNSDVRDDSTAEILLARAKDAETTVGGRRVIGLSTPCATVTENEWERLESAKDGDIVCLHFYPNALDQASLARFSEIVESRALTVLHGHAHKDYDYMMGKSHVLGFRGMDPDKAIGGYPCIYYLTVGEKITHREISLVRDASIPWRVREYFGISCVNAPEDVQYAIEQGIGYVELRCDKKNWVCTDEVAALIEAWRAKTNGFLSVHMPNLSWKAGEISGVEKWNAVLADAVRLQANHLTVHPPRHTLMRDVTENADCREALLPYYVEAVRAMPSTTTVGIENLHCEKSEKCDENRCFAYRPEEVAFWVNLINERLGIPERVGYVLDTGHARNNGSFAKSYPLSRWYLEMGNRAVAYHVHQVIKIEHKEMRNHKPLESWVGPMINYCGFFEAWERGTLRHAPVFLEVKGWENHKRSMEGFDRNFTEQ